MCMTDNLELLNSAKVASANAYCPYSHFSVGASVEYDSGKIYNGCNVENSSYGLSLCAERNAISSAIASGEKGKILKIAIYSPNAKKCMPCGACRQWLAEFEEGQNITVIMESETGGILEYGIAELLPESFGRNMLENEV